MNTHHFDPSASRKTHVRGQGMTEYIIIVALIAIAAIATTTFFGKTVRHQVAAMAAGLAGNQSVATSATTAATNAGGNAQTHAGRAAGLNNFASDVGAR